MSNENIITFDKHINKIKEKRAHDEKDAKLNDIRQRFSNALPDKKTPVKDYLKKKRAKKNNI